jgi:hypothetical protein
MALQRENESESGAHQRKAEMAIIGSNKYQLSNRRMAIISVCISEIIMKISMAAAMAIMAKIAKAAMKA